MPIKNGRITLNMMKNKMMLLVTVIFMDLLTGMEFDLFVPSFHELQTQFHLTPFFVEALLSSNFIGYCLSLFLVGSLSDHYGRKSVILFGLGLFIIGSIFCVWGIAYPILLIGRFLQGAGIAAPAILSFLVIADAYPLKKQQYFMAMLNVVMNTACAIAPVIGSYVTLYFHWQGNFQMLLWLGVVTGLMALFFIPIHKLPDQKETLSLRGYLPLFQSKPLLLLMVNIICLFVPYWIFVGMSPLLYMKDLGVSLSHFGYYQGVLAFTFAIGCLLFGLIMHRYSAKTMLKLSLKICAFSFISLLWVTVSNNLNPLWITIAFLPFIISQIIPSNILFPLCLNFISEAKGKISAVLQGSRLILSALSLQLAGHFYEGNFQNIGLIINGFILVGIMTQWIIIKNVRLMRLADSK